MNTVPGKILRPHLGWVFRPDNAQLMFSGKKENNNNT
jgi:hypothetical protein